MDLRCKSMDWFLYDEDLRHQCPIAGPGQLVWS